MVKNRNIPRACAALLVMILLLLPMGALAAEAVVDECGLFTAAEIAQMETLIGEIRETYQMDAAVLTTKEVPANRSSESEEKTQAYADDYYDQNGYGLGEDRAGILYMIDMKNRVLYISTNGVMIDYISDSRLEDLLDTAYEYAGSKKYGQSAIAVLQQLKSILSRGIEEGHFRYDDVTGERLTGLYNKLTGGEMIVAGIAGIAALLIMYFSVTAKYELKHGTYRFDKDTQSSVELSRNDKTFLRETVTRTRISQSSGGGGHGGGGGRGSGVHRSSGGGFHGGGGRHF